MSDSQDIRPQAAITLVALAEDPKIGLSRAASLGVRGIQISAAQPGTRPRDLGESARRDLLASARRQELVLSGIDAWVVRDDLLDPARVGAALEAINESIALAADLGRIPLSIGLPQAEGAQEVVMAIAAEASRRGVSIVDHAVPIVERDGIFQIGIDPPMWFAAGNDPLDGVREAGGRLGSFRLADLTAEGMRTAVGSSESRLDLQACLLTARVAGFEGLWIVDARKWIDPLAGIHRTLRCIQGT